MNDGFAVIRNRFPNTEIIKKGHNYTNLTYVNVLFEIPLGKNFSRNNDRLVGMTSGAEICPEVSAIPKCLDIFTFHFNATTSTTEFLIFYSVVDSIIN